MQGVNVEVKNRIRASLFAYAYEIMNHSLISDAEFDALCLKIDPKTKTGNDEMDNFFATEFSPHTGMWIHKHPQWEGIARIYQSITGKMARHIGNHKPIKNVPISTDAINFGVKTNTDMKFYLARLGFKIVPFVLPTTRGMIWLELDKDGIVATNKDSGEQKIITWADFDKYR